MKREDAVRKIRSLLNRNGRTEAEADTAQIIAAALAEKWNVDLDEAAADKPEDQPIIHREVGEWTSEPPEATYAALICSRFFDVSQLTLTGWNQRLVLIGTERHLEIATYVYEYLVGEFRRQWNRRRGRCRKRKDFIWGAFCALSNKLNERRQARDPQATNALVVSGKARRDKYVESQWGETTSKKCAPTTGRSAAAARGWRAGRDIEIRPGVKAGPAPAGFLTGERLALPAPR